MNLTKESIVEQLLAWNPAFKEDAEEMKKLYLSQLTAFEQQAREAGYLARMKEETKPYPTDSLLSYQAGQKDTLEKVVDEIERFRERLPVQIVGSLKSERDAHGEITIGGARKRIIHGLREPFNNLFSALKDITN